MEAYFEAIPKIGDLRLEHAFYEYEEPVLFVCLDRAGRRWLCSCCRLSQEWIVGQVGEQDLLDIIDKTIALDGAFRRCGEKFFLTWDGQALRRDDEIPDSAYPKEGARLRLSPDRTAGYLRPYVAQITQACPYEALHIPFMNFQEEP